MKDTNLAKILIVDDNPQNIELLETHLAIAGYETITSATGGDAVKRAKKDQPDIILLDIMMPDIDGYEVCRQIKAHPKTKFIPIIMITALKDIEDRIRGIEAGAEEFLTKPFDCGDCF